MVLLEICDQRRYLREGASDAPMVGSKAGDRGLLTDACASSVHLVLQARFTDKTLDACDFVGKG